MTKPDPRSAGDSFADGPHTAALRARGLGFRYGRRRGWALRNCELTVPQGSITALVGPNGSGKSTLFHLAADLIRPAEGELRVFGSAPGTAEARRRTAFLAQDKPLYPRWSVADTLRLGRELNATWDQSAAEAVVRAGGIDLAGRVGSLSGGQRSRVALAVALGKRPELVLLDEPLADLDPVVREEFMSALLTEVADRGMTVVLSSHVLTDIEHTCDRVLLLADGGVRLAGDADALRSAHTLVTGRADTAGGLTQGPHGHTVVHSRVRGRQFTALVRLDGARAPGDGDGWTVEEPGLEDVLLGYLRAAGQETPSRHDRRSTSGAGEPADAEVTA